ncbi:MAG: type II secretion system protein N [Gammaproteobacteria bacterium]|nr:type II secretion system protein N [Gammaproteobacteria bacterium]
MTMRRAILIGVFAFLASALAFAPASLVRGLVADVPGLALVGLSGTIWNGRARLTATGIDVGQITFRFRPADLLQARVAYDLRVEGPDVMVTGVAAAAAGYFDCRLDGTLGAAIFRDYLSRFDLKIPGELRLQEVNLRGAWDAPLPGATGEIHWSGGDVAYRLGGRNYHALLPQLAGYLDASGGSPVLTVYAQSEPTPLMFLNSPRTVWQRSESPNSSRNWSVSRG